MAALRYLAEKVEVSSRPQGQTVSCTKIMTETKHEILLHSQQSAYIQHGTTVVIHHLFQNLPVRAKAVKREVEVSLIKEFLQKMSVLHHHISWLLVDHGRRTVLCDFPNQLSVSKQIINFHGMQVVSKLKEVRYESSRFAVQGLLSAPTQSCCSWTKDCQYMYINNRWMRNKDQITLLLNKYYSKIFSANQFGPSPKHSSSEAVHNLKFPMFVLKFSCPANECDILVEPDKTMVYFKHQYEVESFILQFLCNMSKVEYPDFFAALQRLQLDATAIRSDITPSTTPNKKQKITPMTEKLYWDDLVKASPLNLSSGLEDTSLLAAFLSSPPREPSPTDISVTMPKDVYFSAIASSGTITKIPPFSQVFSDQLVGNTQKEVAEASRSLGHSPMVVHSLDHNLKSQFTTEILQREGIKPNVDVSVPVPVVSSTKELTLEKKALQYLTYLGRWDNKYLLAMDLKTNLLISFDQHASDERINYEELLKQFNQNKLHSRALDKSRKITLQEFQMLQSYDNILKGWSFDYSVDTKGMLHVQQVPVLFGEALTIDDMLEFIHFMHDHQDIPKSVLKPPALQRILASKACHASVKFGDYLSNQQSMLLIDKLTQTDLPFQCAHGRPSAVPLMDLKELFGLKVSQRKKRIRPHF